MKTFSKLMIPVITLLFTVWVFSSCEYPAPAPQQTISYKEAGQLENNFLETRAEVINRHLGYEDTREFWFSLDSLKKYIAYVEYEAGKREISNLGVRVYFGTYPPSASGKDSLGYSTVFFIPTRESQTSPIKQGFVPFAAKNENIEEIEAFNFGQGGIPPYGL
jgi:hypothetical protein